MRLIVSVLFFALCGGNTPVPNMSDIAVGLSMVASNADYSLLWDRFKGDALTTAAIATRNSDQMVAAVLLGGTIMARGVSLPVKANGLSALCEIMLSGGFREEFFSEEAFQAKRQAILEKKRKGEQAIAELFPLINLHYVCGDYLPLSAKVAVLKQRVLFHIVTTFVDFDQYLVLFSSMIVNPALLNKSFAQWLQGVNHKDDLGYGIARDSAHNDNVSLIPPEPLVSEWLNRVIGEMFASKYFTINNKGEYGVVLRTDQPLTLSYRRIGQLLALAIMNSVEIHAVLDNQLLHALTTQVATDELPLELRRIRYGFHTVLSKFALWGSHYSPKQLLNEQELSDVLRGRF